MRKNIAQSRISLLFAGAILLSLFVSAAHSQPASALLSSGSKDDKPSLLSGMTKTVDSLLDGTLGTVETILPVTQPVLSPVRTITGIERQQPETLVVPANPTTPSNNPAPAPANNKDQKSKDEKVAVTSTTSNDDAEVLGTGTTAKDEPANDGGVFQPIAALLQLTGQWVITQPLISLIIFAALSTIGAFTLVYTFLQNRHRLELIKQNPMQRERLTQTHNIMVGVSVLAIGTSLMYVVMIYV